jgi:phosphoribosylformylglycinamidine synthase I
MPKFGVVVFPGSNCDHDAYHVLKHVFGMDTRYLWHKDHELADVDVVVLPGGFSYGDYLRCGAIARFSPIMQEVIAFSHRGGVVVGICNGFQILCEAGLLPGALLRNDCLKFVCDVVHVRVESNRSRFTSACRTGDVLKIPIAHGEGNYFADDATVTRLEANGQILFRYADSDGCIVSTANPNGSTANIAGIVNERGNVMGMMPHPERAADPALGLTDGQLIFRSLIESFVLHEHTTSFTERS